MINPAASEATVQAANGFQIVVVDSLAKVRGSAPPRQHATGEVVLAVNGTGSVQLGLRPPDDWRPAVDGGALLDLSAPPGVVVTASAVDLVPCEVTALPPYDDDYDEMEAALLPDVLRPLAQDEAAPMTRTQWRAVWLTVRATAPVDGGTITVALRTSRTGKAIGAATIPVTVVDAELPPLPIRCAQWLHVDGISQYYRCDPYSAFGWAAIERFVRAAVETGSTAMLTPIHTPPLDTAVGTTRPDVSLVGVTRTGPGEYRFDLRRLITWISVCRRSGIRELEMAHLFTQWGGTAAPTINDADGRQLFGWHTQALGPEYQDFLAQYIPAVRSVLDQHWGGPVLWHLTDEPHGPEHRDQYRRLRSAVAPLLRDCTVVDALSDLDLWTSGVVDVPVVATNHIHEFLDAGLERPWVYYCTGQSQDVANRFISQPSWRNRALGWQLYRFDCAGFLHWGFNFYNSALSRGSLDPFRDPTAGGDFQAGDPFIVYPGPGGEPWPSIRSRVFREGLDDLSVLTRLGERDGREVVARGWGIGELRFDSGPDDPAFYVRGAARAVRALGRDRHTGGQATSSVWTTPSR